MIATVQKWGNSLAFRIPKSIASDVHVANGSEVDLSVRNDQLIVSPLKRKRYRLSSLLEQIHPKNIHAGIDFGGPTGRELL